MGCRGGGTKCGRGLLPWLKGHLSSAPRPSSWRTSPGAVKGGEGLRGLQGSPLWAAPLWLGRWDRLLGRQGQGSFLGRCSFPVDAECHLLSHRSRQHLGFSGRTLSLGLLLKVPLPALAGPSCQSQRTGSFPKGWRAQQGAPRDQQGACAGSRAQGHSQSLSLASAPSQTLISTVCQHSGRRWASGTLPCSCWGK